MQLTVFTNRRPSPIWQQESLVTEIRNAKLLKVASRAPNYFSSSNYPCFLISHLLVVMSIEQDVARAIRAMQDLSRIFRLWESRVRTACLEKLARKRSEIRPHRDPQDNGKEVDKEHFQMIKGIVIALG